MVGKIAGGERERCFEGESGLVVPGRIISGTCFLWH
jgi:hypothetical protein